MHFSGRKAVRNQRCNKCLTLVDFTIIVELRELKRGMIIPYQEMKWKAYS